MPGYRRHTRCIVKVFLLFAGVTGARAQDSAADAFSRMEGPPRPVKRMPALPPGLPQFEGLILHSVPARIDDSGEKRFFERVVVGGSIGWETKESKSPTGFAVDQFRYDVSTALTHGDRKRDESLVRLTPALTIVDGAGDSEAGTRRDTASYTPGFTLGYVPIGLNSKDALQREYSGTILLQHSWGESEDITVTGTRTAKDTRVVNAIPAFAWQRYFGPELVHSVRVAAQYGYRETRTRSEGKSPTQAIYQSSALSSKLSIDLHPRWSWVQSATYDFPIHEKVDAGEPKTGDATVAASTGFEFSPAPGNILTLEYRHVFGDRSNRVRRVTLYGKVVF